MKFSMDGFRKNLSYDVNKLKKYVECAASGEMNCSDIEDLIESANNVIIHSNVINCVYDDDCEMFNDLSDIKIDIIEDPEF